MNNITRGAMVVAAFGLAQQAYAADANLFQAFSYSHYNWGGTSSVALPGRLYIPTNYNPAQSYPLVVFYHGAGEWGTDNTKQVNSNIDNLFAAAQSRNFFLYAPQSENQYGCWQPTSNAVEAPDLDMAVRQVAAITQQYSINTSQMYVTGLSYGGAATWTTIGAYRNTFAAAVPVVAAGAFSNGGSMAWLAGKPIWSYEATDDQFCMTVGRPTVNNLNTVNGVGASNFNFSQSNTLTYNGSSYYPSGSVYYYNGNGTPQRYTEYNSGGHTLATWGRAYGEAPMYDWLLSQSQAPHKLQTGESIMIDLGVTATTVANGVGITTDSNGRTWNSDTMSLDAQTPGVTVPFCMTTAGVRTPVCLSVAKTFYSDQQTRASTAATLYDGTVTKDCWVSSVSQQGQFRVSGLTPGGQYSVSLFASDTDSDGAYGRLTRYIILDANGSQQQDLNIVNNINTSAIFNVTAGADGMFLLSVAPAGTARYGEISAITVVAVPEPTGLALMALGLACLQRRHRA